MASIPASSRIRGGGLLCAALALGYGSALAADSATVKTRDGRTLNGKLQGRLLLKDIAAVETRGQDSFHLVRYTLLSGGDVLAIDEAGVHLDSAYLTLAVAAQAGGPPKDADVIAALCDVTGTGQPAAATRAPLAEKASLALSHVRVALWGIGSPVVISVDSGWAMSFRGGLGFDAATARLAEKLSRTQTGLLDGRVKATKQATGKKAFALPDEVLGEALLKGQGGASECAVSPKLRVVGASGASEVNVSELVARPQLSAADALGGLAVQDVLERRLDEFYGMLPDFPGAASKKDRPQFDTAVVGPLAVEGVDVSPEGQKAFEEELKRRLVKRKFARVLSAAEADAASGGRVLDVAALATQVASRPVVACKAVDRASGRTVFATSVPLAALGHKGDVMKQMAEAAIYFSRFIEPKP